MREPDICDRATYQAVSCSLVRLLMLLEIVTNVSIGIERADKFSDRQIPTQIESSQSNDVGMIKGCPDRQFSRESLRKDIQN